MKNINKDFSMNEEIREKEIRLIGSNGEPLGIVPTIEAKKLAEEKDMDLVMMSPTAKPPVCRIMDYGKYVYEQSKKKKMLRKSKKSYLLKK
ncbi:translation initiation factor IF-3 [Clostridium beijerinckii]|nr:translation initiation factor IF-3 [Clostridium beijerinckii]